MAMPTDPGDIATGATITETYLDRLRAFALWAGTGVTSSPASWTSFSATITQSGSVSMSTNSCEYARFGDMVVYVGKLIASASGTSSNNIVVGGLPVAITSDRISGVGLFQDGGAANYMFMAYQSTTTAFIMYGTAGSGVGAIGNANSVANVAIASGDVIWFMLFGEAA